MEKDVALAFLGGDLATAGLLLIFCGFLFSKAESFETRRGDKYRILAKIGVIPLILAFLSAGLCVVTVDDPAARMTDYGMLAFVLTLVSSALYSIIALIVL